MKKRFFVYTLILVFALSATACSGSTSSANETASETAADSSSSSDESGTDSDNVSGGFTVAEDATGAEIPQEVQEALDTALEEEVGVSYSPVVYLGSQELIGTSYEILCQATAVTADPVTTYKVVTVYGDSENPFTIQSVADFDLGYYAYETGSIVEDAVAEDATSEDSIPEDTVSEEAVSEDSIPEDTVSEEAVSEDSIPEDTVSEDTYELSADDMDGEWVPYTTQNAEELPEEVATVFEACTFPSGRDLVPVAYLGSQVVSGTNYAILCVVSDSTGSRLAMATVYDPVSGETPSITNLAELNLAELIGGDDSAA